MLTGENIVQIVALVCGAAVVIVFLWKFLSE
jgi:hypothetical protein